MNFQLNLNFDFTTCPDDDIQILSNLILFNFTKVKFFVLCLRHTQHNQRRASSCEMENLNSKSKAHLASLERKKDVFEGCLSYVIRWRVKYDFLTIFFCCLFVFTLSYFIPWMGRPRREFLWIWENFWVKSPYKPTDSCSYYRRRSHGNFTVFS